MKKQDSRIYQLILSALFSIPFITMIVVYVEDFTLPLALLAIVISYVFVANIKLIKTNPIRLTYILVGLLKCSLAIFLSVSKPDFLSGVDWMNFHRYATEALSGSDNVISLYQNSLDLYVFMTGVVYWLFGEYPVYMYFASLLFSLITFRFIYKGVNSVAGEKIASIFALVYLLWPVNIFYTSSYLREGFIQMLVAWSFVYFTKYLELNYRKDLLKAIAIGVAAALVHSGLLVLVLVYVYIATQRFKINRKKMISLKGIVIAVMVLTVLLASPFGESFMNRFNAIGSAEAINYQYAGQLEAATTYINSSVGSVGEFVMTAPYRFVMFALSPLPWQIKGFDTAIAWILDGVLQFIVVVLLYKAWREYRRNKNNDKKSIILKNIIVVGLLAIVLSYLVFAMGTNNYGSAMRHRTKVLPIVLITVASYGALRRRSLVFDSQKVSRDSQNNHKYRRTVALKHER